MRMKNLFLVLMLTGVLSVIGYFTFMPTQSNQCDARSGCCSHHGGVAYCGKSGYYICNDGTQSPTCTCR